MNRNRSLILAIALGAAVAAGVAPAAATEFRDGDLYLLTGGHPDPEISIGVLRIDPDTGEVVSLGEPSTFIYPGSFCYDPYRGRLLGRHDEQPGGLLTMDADGVIAPLSDTIPGPFLMAPRGDGILYAHMFGTNDFYYLDAGDEIHPLLDPSGETFSLGNDASPTELFFDATSNALLVFGGSDDHLPGCPDETRSCVLRVPLSYDGTRVAGDVAALQVDISPTPEIVVGVGRAPGAGVLWVVDTNSNDQEPRLQLLDPVAMTSTTYAANGAYTGAAATNAGTFSRRLGQAVILDTYHNRLRAFALGTTGGGTAVAEEVSDTGSGETARLVEIRTAPYIGVEDEPVRARSSLSAAPNPFTARTSLRINLADPASVTLAVYDVRGRLVRSLARGALPVGSHVFAWDGRDGEGRPVAPGVYFARLDQGVVTQTRAIARLR